MPQKVGMKTNDNMKTLILFLTIVSIGACKSDSTRQDATTTILNNEKKESSIRIEILNNSQFICFTPIDCQLEYVVETPPATSDSTIMLSMAASFTGQRMETFKYSNICGTYLADSVVYNRNSGITTNIDASFAYWNDSAYFAKGKDKDLLDSAIKNNGVFFMQKHVLCNGERGQMNLTKLTIYRVLAKHNDKLCVIQNTQPMTYPSFVDKLEEIGVRDAIYLDMGGWKYSWYRNNEGKVIEIFPTSNDTKYQTNWIVFKKKD